MKLYERGQPRLGWLTTSCFCSMGNWNIILKKIQRIVEDLKCDLFTFHIQFNNRYGDNVRIMFLTIEEHMDDFGQKVTLRLEPLFSSFPKETFKSPISSIKLPFPTNTFEFGLHKTTFDENLFSTYKVQEALSTAIIEALKEEEIARDTLISFSLYLRVSLLKVCSQFLNKKEKWLSYLIQKDLKPKNDFASGQNANFDLALEITKEVMENAEFKEELEWLGRWYNECSVLMKEEILALPDRKCTEIEKVVKEFYSKSTYLVIFQVGLSEIEIRFTNSLFNYSLYKFFKLEEVE